VISAKYNPKAEEELSMNISYYLTAHSLPSPMPMIPSSAESYKRLGQPTTNMKLPKGIRLLGLFSEA
jgi:hypothetical protein